MFDALIPYAVEIVASLALAAISVFGAWLMSKLGQKKQLENVSEATEQVVRAAQLTVSNLQQTLVDGWKATAPSGKLSPAQIEVLKSRVFVDSMALLSGPTKQLLDAAKIDTQKLISGAAELILIDLKKTK